MKCDLDDKPFFEFHNDSVATVGFPNIGLQGFAPKFAKGEIAALSGAGDDARYFQSLSRRPRVPVQPGNSGGALVDERGNCGFAETLEFKL